MESHHVLAKTAIDTMSDITAFSALPGAPIQPERHSSIRHALASLRRRTDRLGGRRPPISTDVVPAAAGASRMSACA